MLLTEVKPIISRTQNFITLAGHFQSNQEVLLQDIVLSELKHMAYFKNLTCQIYIGLCFYDITLGRYFS